MTPSELRLKAAEIIEQRGWCQGRFHDSKGRCCIVGALALAADAYGRGRWFPELRSMGFALTDAATAWNDVPGRTQADVLAKLREGIAS